MLPSVLNRFLMVTTGLLPLLTRSCDHPFTLRFDVCLFWNKSVKVDWCQSQAYCGQFNGELVTGQNAIKLNGKNLGVSHYFIGLTDLPNERRNNRSGWRWTDGSLEPNSSLLAWSAGEPGYNVEDVDYVIQMYDTGTFGDHKKATVDHWKATVMCQPRQGLSPTWKTKRSSKFQKVAVPVFSDPCNYAGGGGCVLNVTGVETSNQCAVECLGHELDWCVAFYHHELTQLCMLVLYTDQAINVGDGVGWTKFVRQN